MRYNPADFGRRPGAIAPLTAVMCIFLVAMVAFAVDLSWMVLTESELQSAADAAALAGSQKLLDPYVQYQLPGQSNDAKKAILTAALADARATARKYAEFNGAGGKKSLALRDDDIEFGVTKADGTYSANYTGFPNTIKVLLRRDDTSNGSLALFFAPALGTPTATLQATASATLYAFKNQGNLFPGVGVLPVAYDVNHWNNFFETGTDPDGNINYTTQGIPKLQVYPSNKYKGNFGYLSLDDAHASSSQLASWIHDGITRGDIDTLTNNGLIPLSERTGDAWDWRGTTGFKSSNVMDVNEYIGKTFTLPLFKPKEPSQSKYEAGVGQGANYDYNIVQFIGVKIVQPNSTNKQIFVVPSAIILPTSSLALGSSVPAGTSGQPEYFFSVPRLSR